MSVALLEILSEGKDEASVLSRANELGFTLVYDFFNNFLVTRKGEPSYRVEKSTAIRIGRDNKTYAVVLPSNISPDVYRLYSCLLKE